jgi:HEAT repeat protein
MGKILLPQVFVMRCTIRVTAGLLLCLGLTFSVYGQGNNGSKETKEPPKEVLGRSLKEWIEDLKSTDPSVKVRALQALPYFGEPARKEAGFLMIGAVENTDASVRVNALIAIGQAGLADKDLPHCIEVVKGKLGSDSQGIVRLQCATLLGLMGHDARSAIPELIRATKDVTSYEIRKTAVTALGVIGGGDAKNPVSDFRVTHALVEVFYGLSPDRSADVRLEAVMAVALMAKPSPPAERAHILAAMKATAAAAQKKDKIIEIWARVGIMAHDEISEKELALIAKYLQPTENIMVRMHAVRALGTIGGKAKGHVEDLMRLLDDKDIALAALAAVALGQMGTSAKEAVPAIEKLMGKKELDDGSKDTLKGILKQISGKKSE